MVKLDRFRIHSIMVVKDEGDIIAHTLRKACEWSDTIYVMDNGSTDVTWEVVKSMASSQIVPFKQDDRPFHDWVRYEVFDAYRSLSRPGDWWCRLDGDEIYIDNPREFLGSLPSHETSVWNFSVDYYLTADDIENVEFASAIERLLPQLRHYKITHSEMRFFRYRDRLEWAPPSPWPRHCGPVARRRIRLRHYKYRSPEQIQKRMDIRRAAYSGGCLTFANTHQVDWREKIAPSGSLPVDSGSLDFVYDPSILPDHLGPWWKRTMIRSMHGLRLWP